MIFTVIIALEFKKSLLVVAERRDSVVQIRSVVMIALLAVCRKVIILDLSETDALHTLAFAAAIFALGAVYWLVRDSDQRFGEAARGHSAAGSPIGDEDREFLQRPAAGSRQDGVAGRIVQLEVTEWNGDELAAKSGKIADCKDNVNVAVLAEDEIVNSPDRLVLVVDHWL